MVRCAKATASFLTLTALAALTSVGLFREAGSLSETLALKRKFASGALGYTMLARPHANQGAAKGKVSLSNSSKHSIASLLSHYLLDLEPPLLTYSLYDAWIGCMGTLRTTAALATGGGRPCTDLQRLLELTMISTRAGGAAARVHSLHPLPLAPRENLHLAASDSPSGCRCRPPQGTATPPCRNAPL